MNKQQLIELIQSLPDNLEVMPITFQDSQSQKVGDTDFIGLQGLTYRAQYEETRINDLTFTLHFKTRTMFEFQRDQYGTPMFAKSNLNQ